MIYIIILSPILSSLLLPKRFPLYITVLISMYLFYGYIWLDAYFLYVGKAGWKGFALFFRTMFTTPFYVLIHGGSIIFAWHKPERNNKVIKANLVGLALLTIHLIAVFLNI